MHLHSQVATTLIAQHERDLLRRAEQRRTLPRRRPPVRVDRRWA